MSESVFEVRELSWTKGYAAEQRVEWRAVLAPDLTVWHRDKQLLISACTQILPSIHPCTPPCLCGPFLTLPPISPSEAGFLAPTRPPFTAINTAMSEIENRVSNPHSHELIRCLLKCQRYEMAFEWTVNRFIYYFTKYHFKIISTLLLVCLSLCY